MISRKKTWLCQDVSILRELTIPTDVLKMLVPQNVANQTRSLILSTSFHKQLNTKPIRNYASVTAMKPKLLLHRLLPPKTCQMPAFAG
jgi:hypothetical protein